MIYSPTNFKLFLVRQVIPWVVRIGTPSFRRAVLTLIPSQLVQTVRKVVDTMQAESEAILKEKKDALSEGDDAVTRQVGAGKDIMSILRACPSHPLPGCIHLTRNSQGEHGGSGRGAHVR